MNTFIPPSQQADIDAARAYQQQANAYNKSKAPIATQYLQEGAQLAEQQSIAENETSNDAQITAAHDTPDEDNLPNEIEDDEGTHETRAEKRARKQREKEAKKD
jgi:hypothetical protein